MVLEFDIRNERSQEKVWTFIYHPEVPMTAHAAMTQPGRGRSSGGSAWAAWAPDSTEDAAE